MCLDLESVGLIQVLPLNIWPQHNSQFSELVFLLCTSSQGCQEIKMWCGARMMPGRKQGRSYCLRVCLLLHSLSLLGLERGKESTDLSPTFHWEPDPAPDP